MQYLHFSCFLCSPHEIWAPGVRFLAWTDSRSGYISVIFKDSEYRICKDFRYNDMTCVFSAQWADSSRKVTDWTACGTMVWSRLGSMWQLNWKGLSFRAGGVLWEQGQRDCLSHSTLGWAGLYIWINSLKEEIENLFAPTQMKLIQDQVKFLWF